MQDKHTQNSRGFGFVTFADPSVVEAVLKAGHVINGKTVEVKGTVPRNSPTLPSEVRSKTKLFVGGLPPHLSEAEFKDYFAFYGVVVEHEIMLDHNTGRSRGFGFITFEDEKPVDRIMAEGKIHEFGGKQVQVNRALPKTAANDSKVGRTTGPVSVPVGGGGAGSGYGVFRGMGQSGGEASGYDAGVGSGYGVFRGMGRSGKGVAGYGAGAGAGSGYGVFRGMGQSSGEASGYDAGAGSGYGVFQGMGQSGEGAAGYGAGAGSGYGVFRGMGQSGEGAAGCGGGSGAGAGSGYGVFRGMGQSRGEAFGYDAGAGAVAGAGSGYGVFRGMGQSGGQYHPYGR